MDPIGLYGNHARTQVNFSGGSPSEYLLLVENTGKISKKTAKLLAALNDEIENRWSDIRKGKSISSHPEFHYRDSDGGIVSIKPIYSQAYPALLVEKSLDKFNHRIILNRQNPNHFVYEKTINTDYGSATLKSYNSRTQDNKEIDNFVDDFLHFSFNKVIPVKHLRYHFEEGEFICDSGAIILR